jgi:predicted Zn-ribbon and HTH transcriptional regulator
MFWNTKEIEYLKSNYKHHALKELATSLGRSEYSIEKKIAKFGLANGINKHKYDYDTVRNIIESKGYSLIDWEYKNQSQKMIVYDNFGYKYLTSFANFLIRTNRKKHLSPIHKNNPYTLENIKIWLISTIPSMTLGEENIYYDSNSKLNFYCDLCKEEILISWNQLRTNKSCPKCNVTDYAKRRRRNPDEILEIFLKAKIRLLDFDQYKNKQTVLNVRCLNCGYEWKVCFNSIRCGSGCPNCKKSRGEEKIEEFFILNKIKYIYQHKFDDCKDKRHLPFDYFLPDFNLIVEYDGELHFEPHFALKYLENPYKFVEITKYHDFIKDQYCEINNIVLIRIPFWEYENIENILERELFPLGKEEILMC